MNSTTYTTLYNQFKYHMATCVSTAVLACAVALPSESYAASPMSQLPDSAFAKMCFTISGLVYRLVQVKDEKLAVQKYEELMDESEGDMAFKASVEEMFFYGMSKRNIYKGDNLKSLLQLQCPGIFKSNSN